MMHFSSDVVQTGACAHSRVPTDDQRKALALYCELAVQRGSITDVLDMVLLLWELWQSAKSDNRSNGLSGASLAPLVDRFKVSTPSGITL